jgi:hypothetical protein
VPIWAPFRLQFYCNGHSWLAGKLMRQGIGYTMADDASYGSKTGTEPSKCPTPSHPTNCAAPWIATPRYAAPDQEAHAPPQVRTLDPMTGRQISPLTAAALCVKPRGQMTARQIINVDALKAASADFTTMHALAMRFGGLLRGGTVDRLDIWLNAARASGIYGMRRFVRTLRQDIEAVRNAVLEPWINGQTESQINRLKTLKRGMYGRAGVDLLRVRMLPLQR